MIDTFPAPAINCFTGSLVRLAECRGRRGLTEAELLERGDGYLLRAGRDERGLPEYTFSVQDCGLQGMASAGCPVRSVEFGGQDPLALLAALVEAHHGAVVWTNSSHLSYADVYANNPGYLHAVLVTEVSTDRSRVLVHDSLVVDRTRYGVAAWLPAEDFRAAMTDRVRTEIYDHMGELHVLPEAGGSCRGRSIVRDLRRQAERFLDTERYRHAVAEYQRLCVELFRDQDERRRTVAARRLFDHVSVLYVVPELTLLGESLAAVDGAGDTLTACAELIGHWRALSVLALKFEATGSSTVLARLEDRFARIDRATTALWTAVAAAPVDGVPVR